MNEMSGEIVKEFLAAMKQRAPEEKKAPESAERRDVGPKEEMQVSEKEQYDEKKADSDPPEKKQIGEQTKEGGAKASDASQDRRSKRETKNTDAAGWGENTERATVAGGLPKAAESAAVRRGRAAHISADETEPAKETVRATENVKTKEGVWGAAEGGAGISTASEGLRAAAVNVNITINGMTVREEADIERNAGQLASRIEQAACLF